MNVDKRLVERMREITQPSDLLVRLRGAIVVLEHWGGKRWVTWGARWADSQEKLNERLLAHVERSLALHVCHQARWITLPASDDFEVFVFVVPRSPGSWPCAVAVAVSRQGRRRLGASGDEFLAMLTSEDAILRDLPRSIVQARGDFGTFAPALPGLPMADVIRAGEEASKRSFSGVLFVEGRSLWDRKACTRTLLKILQGSYLNLATGVFVLPRNAHSIDLDMQETVFGPGDLDRHIRWALAEGRRLILAGDEEDRRRIRQIAADALLVSVTLPGVVPWEIIHDEWQRSGMEVPAIADARASLVDAHELLAELRERTEDAQLVIDLWRARLDPWNRSVERVADLLMRFSKKHELSAQLWVCDESEAEAQPATGRFSTQLFCSSAHDKDQLPCKHSDRMEVARCLEKTRASGGKLSLSLWTCPLGMRCLAAGRTLFDGRTFIVTVGQYRVEGAMATRAHPAIGRDDALLLMKTFITLPMRGESEEADLAREVTRLLIDCAHAAEAALVHPHYEPQPLLAPSQGLAELREREGDAS